MIKILLFLLLFSIGSTAEDTGQNLLKNLQDKFNTVRDLSADFKQSINGKLVLTGKFLFKKEDNLRVEMKNSTLISNGATNWSYNQKENKVIISKNDETNASPFSLKKIVYEYPKECTVSSEMYNGDEVLVLIPEKNSDIGYSRIKIWITKENLIDKIVLTDNADNLIQIDFARYKLNQNISDNKFNFTPPEGSKVIDLR